MKLRFRSLESKQTIKLEVPNDSNFYQLKQTLISFLNNFPPNYLHLSLNRKDELLPPSDLATLQSLGLTSGDLIYFTQLPNQFTISQEFAPNDQTLIQESGTQVQESLGNDQDSGTRVQESLENGQDSGTRVQESLENDQDSGTRVQESLENDQESLENRRESGTRIPDSKYGEDSMEVDYGEVGFKRSFEPLFLKRVLREEEFGADFSDNKLLFTAIHAVLLECGFVGFESASGLRVDLFHILQEQSLMNFTTSVCYTLPILLDNDNFNDFVILKFQSLGQFVNVYGSLLKNRSVVHKLCLDKCKYVPTIGMFWVNWDKSDNVVGNESIAEDVVFELWRTVKDQLALLLLIDICYETGLELPSCLMRLSSDLKLKILESLPGPDIAKMACVCKEMQYLASSNDLWKQKYQENFGSGTVSQDNVVDWKAKFISFWEEIKRQQRRRAYVRSSALNFEVEEPHRLRFPLRGGDYDRFPIFQVPRMGQFRGGSRARSGLMKQLEEMVHAHEARAQPQQQPPLQPPQRHHGAQLSFMMAE